MIIFQLITILMFGFLCVVPFRREFILWYCTAVVVFLLSLEGGSLYFKSTAIVGVLFSSVYLYGSMKIFNLNPKSIIKKRVQNRLTIAMVATIVIVASTLFVYKGAFVDTQGTTIGEISNISTKDVFFTVVFLISSLIVSLRSIDE